MEKEKNMILFIIYYSKENIKMENIGQENFLAKMEMFYMK